MSKQNYATLNVMRGVAAAIVLLFHIDSLWAQPVFARGYLAVDLFFCLSGFVLAYAYGERLASGGMGVARFAMLRLVRFYPLYAVGLALGLVQAIAQNMAHSAHAMPLADVPAALAAALLFLPFLKAGVNIAALNAPGWSLILEFWANILWACGARRASPTVCACIAAACAGGLMWAGQGMFVGMTVETLPLGVLRVVMSFSLGILVHAVHLRVQRLPAALSVAICGLLAAAMFVDVEDPIHLYDYGFAMVASPLLVLIGSRTAPPRAAAQLFDAAGRASFPLYVLHVPFLAAAIMASRAFGLDRLSVGIVAIAALVALSLVADVIDAKVRRWVLAALAARPRTKRSTPSLPAAGAFRMVEARRTFP